MGEAPKTPPRSQVVEAKLPRTQAAKSAPSTSSGIQPMQAVKGGAKKNGLPAPAAPKTAGSEGAQKKRPKLATAWWDEDCADSWPVPCKAVTAACATKTITHGERGAPDDGDTNLRRP